MNKPFDRAIPPPIPEAARRKKTLTGPAPTSLEKKGALPPPVPPEALRGRKPTSPTEVSRQEQSPLSSEALRSHADTTVDREAESFAFIFENGKETHASSKHPDRNEDSLLLSDKRGLVAVADGMGGIPAGEYAAGMVTGLLTREGLAHLESRAENPSAIKLVRRVIEAPIEQPQTQEAVEGALDLLLHEANTMIEQTVQRLPTVQKKVTAFLAERRLIKPEHILSNGIINLAALPDGHQKIIKELYGSVSSTVAIAKTWVDAEGALKLTVANVGDSRVYRYGKQGLDMLTRDHSLISILLQNGATDESGNVITDPDDAEATVDTQLILNLAKTEPGLGELANRIRDTKEARISLRSIRNFMTMTLGGASTQKERHGIAFEPFIATFDLEDDDIILTMSDGVSDNLPKARLREIIEQYRHQGAQSIAHALTTEARLMASKTGGKPDDITIAVTIVKRATKN